MPREVTLVEERGDGRLKYLWAVVMQTIRLPGERVALFGRHNEIGQAQARKQHLAEGSGVKHAALLVEAFEGWQRLTLIAVFAVVIVLDDPATLLVGPLQ